MDWPPPELVDVFEDLSCVFHIQLYPLESVAKVELAVAIVVPIDNLDIWEPEVGQIGNHLISDPLPAFFADGPFLVIHKLVDEEIEILAELFGQVVPQQRNVVLDL